LLDDREMLRKIQLKESQVNAMELEEVENPGPQGCGVETGEADGE